MMHTWITRHDGLCSIQSGSAELNSYLIQLCWSTNAFRTCRTCPWGPESPVLRWTFCFCGVSSPCSPCPLQSRSLGRAANKADQRVSELQARIEELQWDMEKIRRRENRLNAHLSEILERVWVWVFQGPRQDVHVAVCVNTIFTVQVNSKGYKVCGEASSVCGTITINKRKVWFLFLLQFFSPPFRFSVRLRFFFCKTVWGDEQRVGGEHRARRKSPRWAAEAPAGPAKRSAGEQKHEGISLFTPWFFNLSLYISTSTILLYI